MVRIPQDKLNPLEELILSILVHFQEESLNIVQLSWLVDFFTREHHTYFVPPKDGIYLDMARHIKPAKNKSVPEQLIRHFVVMETDGLLTLSQRILEVNKEDYRHITAFLTPPGRKYAEALAKGWKPPLWLPEEPAKLFIANASDNPAVVSLVETVLVPICKEYGFDLVVGNDLGGQGEITRQIFNHIESASGMIVDLTEARPSVYLELGYAMALGMPFMLTCDASYEHSTHPIKKVHFDIRQHSIGYWCVKDNTYTWKKENFQPNIRIAEVFKKYIPEK